MAAIMPQPLKQKVMRTLLAAGLVMASAACAQAADIRVSVNTTEQGTLHARLHAADAENWESPLREARGTPDRLVFDDVPPGRYAIQAFLDLDGNGKLDVSPRGIPEEPVGFSGEPRLGKAKPSPASCAFEHDAAVSDLGIELRRPGHPRSGPADGD